MFKQFSVVILAAAFITAPAMAQSHEHGEAGVARAFIKDIMAEESTYVAAKG